MFDILIVSAIVVVAALFVIRRFLSLGKAGSCGCSGGGSCGCSGGGCPGNGKGL